MRGWRSAFLWICHCLFFWFQGVGVNGGCSTPLGIWGVWSMSRSRPMNEAGECGPRVLLTVGSERWVEGFDDHGSRGGAGGTGRTGGTGGASGHVFGGGGECGRGGAVAIRRHFVTLVRRRGLAVPGLKPGARCPFRASGAAIGCNAGGFSRGNAAWSGDMCQDRWDLASGQFTIPGFVPRATLGRPWRDFFTRCSGVPSVKIFGA